MICELVTPTDVVLRLRAMLRAGRGWIDAVNVGCTSDVLRLNVFCSKCATLGLRRLMPSRRLAVPEYRWNLLTSDTSVTAPGRTVPGCYLRLTAPDADILTTVRIVRTPSRTELFTAALVKAGCSRSLSRMTRSYLSPCSTQRRCSRAARALADITQRR